MVLEKSLFSSSIKVKAETIEEESIESCSEPYLRILKKHIDCGRIPLLYQSLHWDIQNLKSVFGKNTSYHGLSNLLFDEFYSFVLVEERKQSSTSVHDRTSEGDASADETSQLDLTGCPLECPFELSNLGSNEDKHEPKLDQVPKAPALVVCKAEHARLLLNIFLYEGYKYLPSPLPVMFLCDGLDPLNTIFLGAFKEFNAVTHIQATKLPGFFSERNVPSMGSLKRQHSMTLPNVSSEPKIEATSVYQILEASESSFSSITLQCHWEDPFVLLEPPGMNAVCRLDVVIFPGEQSPVSFLYKELLILKHTVEGLQSGQLTWCIEDQDNQIPMSDRLQQLIKDTKEVRHCFTKSNESVEISDNNDSETGVEAILIRKRQNLDFTDYLWNTLMKSTSYNDVKNGLLYIMETIYNGEINPVILRHNKTSLGQWINECKRGKKEFLSLEGMEPVQHLAEIGLRKIQEDYCSLFIGLELATEDILSPYLQSWEDREAAVQSLSVLFATLELVLLCKVYLHLPQYQLGNLARQALRQCKGPSQSYRFSFQIPLIDFQKRLAKWDPTEWQVHLTSNSPMCKLETSVHFANKPFPHLQTTVPFSDTCEDHLYYGMKCVIIKNFI